ncbi:MAG: hypothetical protein KDN20_01325 [Verrucomicrobiae bacterium]|nr:hypothetical protein [Verrucomicrobiae bacterium]
MKAIIFDYFRRYGWAYLLGFCTHVGALILSWQFGKWTSLASVLGGSALILVAHLNRHGATLTRTLLALPLRAKDLSRAWRFVALEFPTLWFLLALALSIVGNQLFGTAHHITTERILIAGIAQTLLLGGVFFALTGLHHQLVGINSTWDYIRANLFAVLWGISIPGSIFMAQAIPNEFDELTPLMWIVGTLLAVATVAGWFRADILVQRRVERFSENAKPNRASKTSRDPNAISQIRGFGGIPLHMFQFGSRAALMGLAILTFNWIFMSFMLGQTSQIGVFKEMSDTNLVEKGPDLSIMTGQLSFIVPILSFILVFTTIGQLRNLRSLPLTRRTITHYLIFWPITFSLFFIFAASAVFKLIFSTTPAWPDLGLAIASSAIALLGIPLILRRGFGIPAIVILMILLPATQLIRTFSDRLDFEPDLIAAFVATIAIALLLLAWFLTYQLLGTNHPWRAGALQLPGQAKRM